ncbi:hypothetical protein TSAR_005093 [Trichomalopsis sarcophagae]|uniref:Uncharacterized protein n=1 Tax=Trichomalopsis sarcophagae TaxID=543379 RepID=A0A232FLN6_9HYME|nr:hypothetical protein TSAR_005093 [Trichomalopsis sarcophagae]
MVLFKRSSFTGSLETKLLHKIQQFQYNSKKLVIKLKNCRSNSLITMKTVENLLKFIKRNQKIGEIKILYQEEKYEELTDILKDSFEMTKHSNPCLRYGEIPIDRAEQLRILLDSLWQLEQYETRKEKIFRSVHRDYRLSGETYYTAALLVYYEQGSREET